MKEREAITSLLRGVVAVMTRQDAERATFEAQFLREFADVKRTAENTHALVKEIHTFLGQLVRAQAQYEQDLTTHIQDRRRHVAA